MCIQVDCHSCGGSGWDHRGGPCFSCRGTGVEKARSLVSTKQTRKMLRGGKVNKLERVK